MNLERNPILAQLCLASFNASRACRSGLTWWDQPYNPLSSTIEILVGRGRVISPSNAFYLENLYS